MNYPHLKKQASEEDSPKTQALNPQVLFFPVYPGDILCHVCKRDPQLGRLLRCSTGKVIGLPKDCMSDMAILAIVFSLLYVIQDFTKSTRMDFFFAISKPPAFFLLSYIVNMPKKSKTGRFFAKNFCRK